MIEQFPKSPILCLYDQEDPHVEVRYRRGRHMLQAYSEGLPTVYDLRIAQHDYLYTKMMDNSATVAERNQFTLVRSDLLDEWDFDTWSELLSPYSVRDRLLAVSQPKAPVPTIAAA